MAYKKHPKRIAAARAKLKASHKEKNPTYPELPDAPPIPKAADDTVAIGVKRRAQA